MPELKDAADQRLIPGVGTGGTEDDEIDWLDEGGRLFHVTEDDFWRVDLNNQDDDVGGLGI